MKLIKQNYVTHLFLVLVIGFLAIHNLTAADIDGFSKQPNSVSVDKETITGKQLETENHGGGSLVSAVEAKTTKTYSHEVLNYSFEYPEDWLLATYSSNGYQAIGLWDPIAQHQSKENGGHLRQGVKIEILVCDCAPATGNLKNTILEWSVMTPEKITKISELSFDFYRDGNATQVISTEFETERGGGKGVYFIDRGGKYYTITIGGPDFSTLNTQFSDYELIFEQILQFFSFN